MSQFWYTLGLMMLIELLSFLITRNILFIRFLDNKFGLFRLWRFRGPETVHRRILLTLFHNNITLLDFSFPTWSDFTVQRCYPLPNGPLLCCQKRISTDFMINRLIFILSLDTFILVLIVLMLWWGTLLG